MERDAKLLSEHGEDGSCALVIFGDHRSRGIWVYARDKLRCTLAIDDIKRMSTVILTRAENSVSLLERGGE